jgi:photosystem II stability/assembly factor-like uncharacterized protein
MAGSRKRRDTARGAAPKRQRRPKHRGERVWRQPDGAEDDGEAIRRRIEWVKRQLAVEDLGRLARQLDLFAQRKARLTALPRDARVSQERIGRSGVAIDADPGVRAAAGKAPAKEQETFGHTGRFAQVRAPRPFRSATLRFRVDEGDVAHLHPGTVLVARWDENERRYAVIPHSGYDEDGGFAYARVTRPGLYTAVGLPRDPRVLTTLTVLSAMRPWLQIAGDRQDLFVDQICQLILCAGFANELLGDRKVLDRFGLDPGDFPSGFDGDVCERCLGLNGGLPELEILDLADLPIDELKPLRPKFPPRWPRPCHGWVNVGPVNVTGRTGVLAIHPRNGSSVYAGTTGGGVWSTANAGTSWTARMHDELSLAIGGLAVASSAPNVLYAATGEWTAGIGWPIDPVVRGVGVYRTSNGGGDWDLCAPIASRNCAAVAVDPTNPNRVFVAGESALHRSTDGGASWPPGAAGMTGVFDGQISDVVIDPNDRDRVYMGVHMDAVYRSTDGGNSWTRLTTGIDTGAVADAPKIALGRNGAHGSQFVAVKMGDRVYTSIDGGTNFTRQTDTGNPIWFTAWANVIAVDPADESILLAGASNLYRSTNGGSSWTQVGGYGTSVHPDMQSVVFDPNDHNHVYVANDGGIWQSTDNGVTWTFASRGLVATHFYVMGVSQSPVTRYGGSVQDDHGYVYDGAVDWVALGLGEGGYIEYDPADEDVIYHDAWFSTLSKSTDGGSTWTNLGIQTDTNYTEPLAIARGNPNLLLALKAGGVVSRSTDGGATWADSPAVGTTLTAVQFAPTDDNTAYAGSATGRIWHSTDGGATWTELDTTALPDAQIQTLAVDWTNPSRLYVAFAGSGIRHLHRGDLTPAGNPTWFDVSGVLPAVSLPDLPLTGLALHPTLDEVLYVSTLLGVLRSTDGGDSWAPFDDGLPNAFVSDLDMRASGRTLYASTMGRGIYRRRV